MHVAFGVPGAPLSDILTPQSWGGRQSPFSAGAVGAEINGSFVSLSGSLHLRPQLGVKRKGEVC